MKEKTKVDVAGYLAKLDPLIRELVVKLRKLVLEGARDMDEVIKGVV